MRIAFLFLVGLLLAGCSGDDSSGATNGGSFEAPAEVTASIVDGIQVVEIEAGEGGFSPDLVRLKAGVPARLIFNRTTEADCLGHVSVPDYDLIRVPLPMHEEVAIEFTPDHDGEFTFVCGMGMQTGTLVVST